MASALSIKPLASRNPDPSTAKSHHVGSPPTSFKNPWPSFQTITPLSAFKTRFGNHPEKGFVPVPEGPNGTRSPELVKVQKPYWLNERNTGDKDRLQATWLGHASFLIETPAVGDARRGTRILFDPVFSERTSPVQFLGPKRYTPAPCSVDELPEVDLVCISHNHYDHLDHFTVSEIYKRRKQRVHFLCGLNDKAWFAKHVCPADQVTELDWWDGLEVVGKGLGAVKLWCTPAQHGSARSGWDQGHGLWCSWVLETGDKTVYFAGDTGYQAVDTPSPCPIFKQIGATFPQIDLALLPIGLFKPQTFMGGVHSSPEQSLEIHKEVRAKTSIGIHYGTFRGGISGQYEPVTEPPRRWREAAEKEGLWRGGGVEGKGTAVDLGKEGVGLCDVGETVVV